MYLNIYLEHVSTPAQILSLWKRMAIRQLVITVSFVSY